MSCAQKAGIVFPASRIRKTLKKDGRTKRVSATSSVCVATALEYLCAEIVELAAQRCQREKRKRITPNDIVITLRADPELHQMTEGLALSAGETLKQLSKHMGLSKSTAPSSAPEQSVE